MLVVSLTSLCIIIASHVARRIIVITPYYYIRSFKCAIILLYVKRRFRVIVCQSHSITMLLRSRAALRRVYNSRR